MRGELAMLTQAFHFPSLYRMYFLAVAAIVIAVVGGTAILGFQQSHGPDVIVGDIPGVSTWGNQGNPTVFSVATTSCNAGDQALNWVPFPNPRHPAISQNLYRLADGRLVQLAASWVKHGFA